MKVWITSDEEYPVWGLSYKGYAEPNEVPVELVRRYVAMMIERAAVERELAKLCGVEGDDLPPLFEESTYEYGWFVEELKKAERVIV